MRLKGSLPDAFAVAEVPKHEISSPRDWLFPPGISSRTDSYNPLTGTPDRLTFFFTWTSTRLTGYVMLLPSVLLGAYCLRTCFLSVRWMRSAFSNWDMSERITRSPSFNPAKTSTVFTEARPSFT
jgi:hypothetical protein